jgi:hypothetical protein
MWLPEEVLTLLFLLHHENGDFSILIKDTLFLSAGLPVENYSTLLSGI